MGLRDIIKSTIRQMTLGSRAETRNRYVFLIGQSSSVKILICTHCNNADYLTHNLDIQKDEPRAIVFECHGCGTEFELKFSRLWCSGCQDWTEKFRIKLTRDSDHAGDIDPESMRLVKTPAEITKAPMRLQYAMYGQCLKCPTKDSFGNEIGGASFDFGERTV